MSKVVTVGATALFACIVCADTTGLAHTTVHIALGMERISRAIVGTPISRTTAIKITSNPTMGTATDNGGSSDRAISIMGEAHGSLATSG